MPSPSRFTISLAMLFACSLATAETSPPPGGAGGPEILGVDTPHRTTGGNPFTGPAGWAIERRGQVVLLTPPESDNRMVLADVEANDADQAVATAWSASGRESRWPVKVANDLPAKDGWEQIRRYNYETSANEQRYVVAQAARADELWNVVIIDFSQAVFEKRLGQILLVADTLLPKGATRESFAGKPAQTLDRQRVATLLAFVEKSRVELGVPGVGFGIVHKGKVLTNEGLGVRELGKPAKVDPKTLFMVASNTKAMTTLLLARLVDRKKLEWQTTVTDVLPTFALGNALTTRKVQIQHLVCACTGLPRQDLEWLTEFATATAESTLSTLSGMQPTTDFGALYQYSNPLASAGGYVAGHALYPQLGLGPAYDRAMQEEVFDPLRMRATTFDFAEALNGNHATAHGEDIDGRQTFANMAMNHSIVPVRPAGGAWSNVDDMLRFVQFELDNGVLPNGRRHVSESALLARRDAKVALGKDTVYGMGLMVDRSWNIPIVFHGGSMIGYQSGMLWLPDQDVGVVLLTNSEQGSAMLQPVQRRLVELLFDGKPEAEAMLAASVASIRSGQRAERKRLQQPADAVETAKLAGRYHNSAIGQLAISRDGIDPVFDFGEWKSQAASRRNDDGTLSYLLTSPGATGWEFVVADDVGRRRLILRSAQQEYVFEEAAR